jgi:glutathione S-transferase
MGRRSPSNVAIQIWIARHFPAAKLLPTDPMQELHAISLMAWCASGIHPFLSRINSPPRVCDVPGAEESVRRLAQQQLFENYQIANNSLAGREWFFDHSTAVDAHFFWCFRRGIQFNLDLAQFKNCLAHFERLKQRQSVRKLVSYEQEVLSAFAQAADHAGRVSVAPMIERSRPPEGYHGRRRVCRTCRCSTANDALMSEP